MNIAYSLFQYDQLQIAKYCKEETMKQEINFVFSEAVYGRCSVKKGSQEFRKIHRKTPVSESLF